MPEVRHAGIAGSRQSYTFSVSGHGGWAPSGSTSLMSGVIGPLALSAAPLDQTMTRYFELAAANHFKVPSTSFTCTLFYLTIIRLDVLISILSL